MTHEEIEAKAAELSEKYKCKVTPIVFEEDGEQIVGYAQEPQYQVILYCQNALAGEHKDDAMEAAYNDCFLKAESDPRMSSEERGCARIRASVALQCITLLTPYANSLKKK